MFPFLSASPFGPPFRLFSCPSTQAPPFLSFSALSLFFLFFFFDASFAIRSCFFAIPRVRRGAEIFSRFIHKGCFVSFNICCSFFLRKLNFPFYRCIRTPPYTFVLRHCFCLVHKIVRSFVSPSFLLKSQCGRTACLFSPTQLTPSGSFFRREVRFFSSSRPHPLTQLFTALSAFVSVLRFSQLDRRKLRFVFPGCCGPVLSLNAGTSSFSRSF